MTPLSASFAWIAAGGLLGAIFGSFLATLVLRWPQGGSIARGRSRCDGCGATLGAADLVPLLSYAALRGRCRRCGTRIARTHPLIEAGAVLIGLVSLAVAPGATGLAGAAFGWVLLALAVLDARHFWLPDRLTLPLLAAGLTLGLMAIPPALIDRLAGAAAGYASLALIAAAYRGARGRTGLGGGDPKIFGAIGAWLGWRALPAVMLAAALLGLGYVLWTLLRGGRYDPAARLPLGTLLAMAAWPYWVIEAVAAG